MSRFIIFIMLNCGFVFAHAAKPILSSKDKNNLAIDQFCNSLTNAGEATCNLQIDCRWNHL